MPHGFHSRNGRAPHPDNVTPTTNPHSQLTIPNSQFTIPPTLVGWGWVEEI
ncbi:MAG: hypothetical protein IPL28_05865 [Chloroflexi bacterium]|nr:hypothetical protein [Chloroflexota bacterium]